MANENSTALMDLALEEQALETDMLYIVREGTKDRRISADSIAKLVTRRKLNVDNVDNTADIEKPVSNPQQEALDQKADKVDTASKDAFDEALARIVELENRPSGGVSEEVLELRLLDKADKDAVPTLSSFELLTTRVEVVENNQTNYVLNENYQEDRTNLNLQLNQKFMGYDASIQSHEDSIFQITQGLGQRPTTAQVEEMIGATNIQTAERLNSLESYAAQNTINLGVLGNRVTEVEQEIPDIKMTISGIEESLTGFVTHEQGEW